MKDKTTNIQSLKDKVLKFVQERDWNDFHNPKNLAMSIAIESSELMEIFQWLNEEESNNIMDSDENMHLQEELADVIIYCLSLANRLDIDISSAIEDKIKKNAIKYPRHFKLAKQESKLIHEEEEEIWDKIKNDERISSDEVKDFLIGESKE